MVIREPSGLGSQHLACMGALMGSGGGSFVGRWHQDSITYPEWPLLIQKHPAGLRLDPLVLTPSQGPVGLTGVPGVSGPRKTNFCSGRYCLSPHLCDVRQSPGTQETWVLAPPAVYDGPGQGLPFTSVSRFVMWGGLNQKI